MPNLPPIQKYAALQPYHHYYDNLPIEDIEDQIFRVNAQVDLTANAVEESIGNVGSLAVRLNVSLEDNGDLKTSAIDSALHSIAEHTDGDGYVRMTDDERSKLTLIDSEATNLMIEIESISTTMTWPNVDQTFSLANSDTIAWRYDSNRVYADTTFAKSLITIPSYDIKPIPISSDTVFKTTSVNTEYKAGTLRVYINGLRLTKSPKTIGGFSYTETNPTIGTFTLNKPIVSGDIIRIDFDQPIS